MSGNDTPPGGGSDGTYRTGYRHPPRERCWKPGQSGNPKGRPKRVPSAAETFLKVHNLPVTVEEGGRKRKITTLEALFRRLRTAALKGDPRAIREYLALVALYAPEQLRSISELFAEDQRLLRELREFQKQHPEPGEATDGQDPD